MFLPRDQGVWRTDTLLMNCQAKLQQWVPPDVYVWNPKLKKGNFFHLCSGALVVDSKTVDRIRDLLEMAGELLPFFIRRKNTIY
jgi:hypothetical protein